MSLPSRHWVRISNLLAFIVLLASLSSLHAVIVRGTVTDSLGRAIGHAQVALVANGKVVAGVTTAADGSYQLSSEAEGRFYVLISAPTFRQLATPAFYAGRLATVEQNLLMEPEWVRQQIVVTATGVPTPQAKVSASATVLTAPDLANRSDLVDPLRQIPGLVTVQQGQRGSLTSIFVRGGNSDANKVTLDGVPAEDLGGRFDFGNLAATGVEQAEVNRGPNSALYGSGAAAGVVSVTTPRGTTSSPSLFYSGDAGNFNTYRNEVQLAGSHRKLDYYSAFSRLDTSNSIPMDKYHIATAVGNFGWQPTTTTGLRGTVRNLVSATGVPNAYDFYKISDDRKQSDQDLYIGATIENQTTPDWHNLARYGLARKREQSQQWYPAGIPIIVDSGFGPSTEYFGNPVTIKGANGYSASGQAVLNYSGNYPNRLDLVSNLDQLYYQSDYRFTPHLMALIAFRFENERAAERLPAYFVNESLERTNYDYTLQLAGDVKGRLFYTLGGGLQKNQLFGTEATPRLGLTYYLRRPGSGVFHGTQLKFNFSKGVKEPTLTEQFGSLYQFLLENNGQSSIDQFHISKLGAPRARSFDGGVEQSLFSQRAIVRVNYFHNEFGKQVESVGAGVVPQLLPNLSPSEQAQLEQFLKNNYAYSLALNSLDFRAQGVEVETELGLGRSIFLRGGYTYLDSVVQHSFSADAVSATVNPLFPNIPIGAYSPLKGARPFRRPPHTGFVTATYTGGKWTGGITGAFSSRSDDSTFLAYSDADGGNTLLLPNRNLDHGYVKIDLGGSYNILPWMRMYAQVENLLSDQHIAPIGYPSLPLSFRSGIRFSIGRGMTR